MLQPRQKRRMLGELLISEGLLTQAQLDQALAEQKRQGFRLGQMLDRLGLVSEKDIISVIGKQMGIPFLPLDQPKVDSALLKLVPEETAKQYQAVPVSRTERSIMIAMVDPLNVFAQDDLARLTGLEVQPVISTAAAVADAINRWYRQTDAAAPQAPPEPDYVPPMERRGASREIVVLVTAATEEEAVRIGRGVVEARLAACANVLPGIRSIFPWEGKISDEREVLLLLKTRSDLFDRVAEAVKGLHSYQVPEILGLPIEAGSTDYLAWIRESTRNST